MWRDRVKERYRWARIHSQMDELIYELTKAEDEEEVGLYLLRLHCDNEIDLKFFARIEKALIKNLLTTLVNDTVRHRELLTEIIGELKDKRRVHA